MRVRAALGLLIALAAAACGSTGDAGLSNSAAIEQGSNETVTVPVPQGPTVPATRMTAAPAADSAVTTPATAAPRASTTAPPTPTAAPTTMATAPERDCVVVEDFGDGADQRWRVVNDGVMGGLSEGFVEFDGDAMVFSGMINTNGGGFSSVRFALPTDWGSATELVMRVRTDGRAYEVQVNDSLDGRNRRITHFGPIPLVNGDQWQEVRVDLTSLEARVFGRLVDAAPFRPELASSVGVILADGSDGAFRFEIDWLDACR